MDEAQRLAQLIVDHATHAWPAQMRATSDGGGWTYADHLARYLLMGGVRATVPAGEPPFEPFQGPPYNGPYRPVPAAEPPVVESYRPVLAVPAADDRERLADFVGYAARLGRAIFAVDELLAASPSTGDAELRAAAKDVDAGWFVVEMDKGRDVRLRYASDLPARLNGLRAALGSPSTVPAADDRECEHPRVRDVSGSLLPCAMCGAVGSPSTGDAE
jgi:hypothetical protein